MDLEGSGGRQGSETGERVRRLRWKAVALCMVCFTLLWGVITIQMAQGDDPALGSDSGGSANGVPSSTQGLPGQGGIPGQQGFPGGGGTQEGSPEEFLFEGGAPEAPGGEALAPMQTGQS